MSPAPQWSNRILILAFLGILFFTLLPFDFDLHATLPGGRSPFLLGGWEKDTSAFGEFLNVLLFIPFGFGISEALTERRRSRLATLTWALALGGLLSYSIEFLQIYVPPRDSGWGDIITNTAGSLVGFLLFDLYGVAILRALSGAELAVGKLLSWPRAALIVPSYFLFCIVVSVPLQMQTRLDNWEPTPLLWVGNDASGKYRSTWEGEVFSLQVWNRPLDRAAVQELTRGNDLRLIPWGLLAAYDFSAHPPLRDQMNFLPELSLDSNAEDARFRPSATPADVPLAGSSWLTSSIPVPNLVRELQKTNQFAIRVVCRPGSTTRMAAAIVSLAGESGIADLELVQKHADLIFAFRNPISADRVFLDWRIRNVFTPLRTRDLVLSYDGNKALFYIDGRPAALPYELGPGAALARYVRHLKTAELDGYSYIYYFLIFFIGGVLVGIAARDFERGRRRVFRLFGFLIPALLLESVLVTVSGRPVSEAMILLSVALTIAGSLWINADPKVTRQANP